MSALLVLYFGFAGVRAASLLASGTPIAIAMGVALLELPLIGEWALVRELLFGARSTALVDKLEAEGLLPDDLGESGATGRPSRDIADAAFARYKAEAEADHCRKLKNSSNHRLNDSLTCRSSANQTILLASETCET